MPATRSLTAAMMSTASLSRGSTDVSPRLPSDDVGDSGADDLVVGSEFGICGSLGSQGADIQDIIFGQSGIVVFRPSLVGPPRSPSRNSVISVGLMRPFIQMRGANTRRRVARVAGHFRDNSMGQVERHSVSANRPSFLRERSVGPCKRPVPFMGLRRLPFPTRGVIVNDGDLRPESHLDGIHVWESPQLSFSSKHGGKAYHSFRSERIY